MKKILILVMAHSTEDAVFNSYKNAWDKKIKIFSDKKYLIDTLFLYSNENIKDNYFVVDNILYSKCKENYWHSLLIKTLNGLDYFYMVTSDKSESNAWVRAKNLIKNGNKA